MKIKIVGASSPITRFVQRTDGDGVDDVEEIGVIYGFRFVTKDLQRTLAECVKEFSVLQNFDYPNHSLTMRNKHLEGFTYFPDRGFACIKDEIKASNAMKYLFQGMGRNEIDCDIGVQICMFEALRRHLGNKEFDKRFDDVPMYVISTAKYHPLLTQYQTQLTDLSKLSDGDMLFFANHTSYAKVHPIGTAQGQWVIVTDSRKLEFGGHFGNAAHYLHTAEQIFEELVVAYNAPHDHSFYKHNKALWDQEAKVLKNVLRDNPTIGNKSDVMQMLNFYDESARLYGDEAIRLVGLDGEAIQIPLD